MALNMQLLCRVCGKTVEDVKYYADPQFWEVSMKQIFCGATCSTKWVKENKNLEKTRRR